LKRLDDVNVADNYAGQPSPWFTFWGNAIVPKIMARWSAQGARQEKKLKQIEKQAEKLGT
jgi:hypothetical protein